MPFIPLGFHSLSVHVSSASKQVPSRSIVPSEHIPLAGSVPTFIKQVLYSHHFPVLFSLHHYPADKVSMVRFDGGLVSICYYSDRHLVVTRPTRRNSEDTSFIIQTFLLLTLHTDVVYDESSAGETLYYSYHKKNAKTIQ